jgi:glycine cleavage system H protein
MRSRSLAISFFSNSRTSAGPSKKGDSAAIVESVKAASDVYAPLSGEVVEINEALVADPARINTEAEGGAWLFKLRLSDEVELKDAMDEAAYSQLIS